MSRWILRVTNGTGRVTRRQQRILFVERHDPALTELAGPDLDIEVRELAGYAVTNKRCPTFVFIDLDKATLLAHGDTDLQDRSEGSPPLQSSSLGFIEASITAASIFSCNHSSDCDDTSLDDGTVPASGFLLVGPESTSNQQADVERPAANSAPGPVRPFEFDTKTTPSVAAETRDADLPDDLAISNPQPTPPSPPTDPLPNPPPNAAPNEWDPWHRDPGIDLATIGSPTPASAKPEEATSHGTPDPHLDAAQSNPADAITAVDAITLADDGLTRLAEGERTSPFEPPPERDPGLVGADANTLPPIPGMPSTPSPSLEPRPEPVDPERRAALSSPQRPGWPADPSGQSLQLTFDDGQIHTIRAGAIVGRNPTREQIPPGFTAITVRSEHVSRRHWRVDFIDGKPTVSDLGSQAGTTIETTDGPRLVPTTGVAIRGDERVVFADRWATIDRL